MVTKTQELLFASFLGAVGGWVISTAPGWMHASSHEDWWDIAIAFGTVGAVVWGVIATYSSDRKAKAANDRYVSTFIFANKSRWEYAYGTAVMAMEPLRSIAENKPPKTYPPNICGIAADSIPPLMLSDEVIAAIGEKSLEKGILLAEISAESSKIKNDLEVLHQIGFRHPSFKELADERTPELDTAFENLKSHLIALCSPHGFDGSPPEFSIAKSPNK